MESACLAQVCPGSPGWGRGNLTPVPADPSLLQTPPALPSALSPLTERLCLGSPWSEDRDRQECFHDFMVISSWIWGPAPGSLDLALGLGLCCRSRLGLGFPSPEDLKMRAASVDFEQRPQQAVVCASGLPPGCPSHCCLGSVCGAHEATVGSQRAGEATRPDRWSRYLSVDLAQLGPLCVLGCRVGVLKPYCGMRVGTSERADAQWAAPCPARGRHPVRISGRMGVAT